jgi:phosphopantetheinyl transferase (holo-ACP synthase)
MCTPEERAAVEALPSALHPRRLAELWTAKEARAKADGRGLAIDFRTLPAEVPASRATSGPVTCIVVRDGGGRTAWHRIEEFALEPAVRR